MDNRFSANRSWPILIVFRNDFTYYGFSIQTKSNIQFTIINNEEFFTIYCIIIIILLRLSEHRSIIAPLEIDCEFIEVTRSFSKE